MTRGSAVGDPVADAAAVVALHALSAPGLLSRLGAAGRAVAVLVAVVALDRLGVAALTAGLGALEVGVPGLAAVVADHGFACIVPGLGGLLLFAGLETVAILTVWRRGRSAEAATVMVVVVVLWRRVVAVVVVVMRGRIVTLRSAITVTAVLVMVVLVVVVMMVGTERGGSEGVLVSGWLDGESRGVDEDVVEFLRDLVGVGLGGDVDEGVAAHEADGFDAGDVLELHAEKTFRHIASRAETNKKSDNHFFFKFFF